MDDQYEKSERTYIVAVTLENLPEDPDQLLVITHRTIRRQLDCRILFFDESAI